jgi:tetratricopeptide (TPR) repeat protein
LLQDEGRATEASDLARRYSDSPLTSQDVLQMANVFDALKMTDYAVVFLAKQILVFREDADLWVTRAEMLTRLRRWDDLREMAVAMRSERRLARRLTSYSYYVDGLVDYYLGQLENAGSIFPKVLESPFPTPSMAVRAAANLRTIGFPKVATELLKTNEAVFSNQKEFWLQLTISAYASGDSVLLERAARRGYELDPTSTQAINDYAAALIANRAQPDEAVTLTLKLIADDPERLGFLINHAMALILNRRLDEAERIVHVDQLRQRPGSLRPIRYLGPKKPTRPSQGRGRQNRTPLLVADSGPFHR